MEHFLLNIHLNLSIYVSSETIKNSSASVEPQVKTCPPEVIMKVLLSHAHENRYKGGAACTTFECTELPGSYTTLAEMAAVSSPVVYKEGIVYKRSRGRRHPSRVKKTQKRFCRLTEDSFDYFEPPKKGSNLDTVNTDLPYNV